MKEQFIATKMYMNSLTFTRNSNYEDKVKLFKDFTSKAIYNFSQYRTFVLKGKETYLYIYADTTWYLYILELISQYASVYDGLNTSKHMKWELSDDTILEIKMILMDVGVERGWSYWTGQKS